MPKIMYRPNPTPPPFVPPVPPAPTGPYVTMSPFPFEVNAEVLCTVHNVELDPSVDYAYLYVRNDTTDVIDINRHITPPHTGPITFLATADANSDNLSDAEIFLYSEGIIDENIHLTIYQP